MPHPEGYALALIFVLDHEGGFVDHPADPGGATNLGISLRFLRALGTSLGDVDQDGDIDAEDVQALTREDASRLYRTQFWEPLRLDELPVPLAMAVFDFAVNTGPRQAVRDLQRTINDYTHPSERIAVDGALGPITAGWARDLAGHFATGPVFLASYLFRRLSFYTRLVARNGSLLPFLAGWTRRVLALQEIVLGKPM